MFDVIHPVKSVIVVLLFFIHGPLPYAQQTARIKGRVLDRESEAPIPFANVFFNNTSIGAIADSLGNYDLKGVPIQYGDLIGSSLGYESLLSKLSLSSGQVLTMDLKLNPSKKLLKEMVIRGARDYQWNTRYQQFLKIFLGSGTYSTFCKIENPGIISFSESYVGKITASANGPLEIYNRALGYKLSVNLLHFEMTSSGFSTKFYSHYSLLEAKDEKEKLLWQMNRLKSYKGSQRHFLTSLIESRSQAEGFSVFYSNDSESGRDESTRMALRPVAPEVLSPRAAYDGKFPGYFKLLRKGTYEIHYLNKNLPRPDRWYPDFPHPVSWLTLANEFLLSPPNGLVKSNSNDLVSGDMDNYRVADLLPQDYDPVVEEAQIYLARFGNRCSLTGIVTDSISGQPLANARVFINNSFYKTDTDPQGRFEIKKLSSGEFILVITHRDHLIDDRKIAITGGQNAELVIKIANKNNGRSVPGQKLDSLTDAKKTMYFRRYLLPSSSSAVNIANPGVLQLRITEKKIVMFSTSVIELEDRRSGYKLHYFLKTAEFDRGQKKTGVVGFASFDSLLAKNANEARKWTERRDELYRELFPEGNLRPNAPIETTEFPVFPIEYVPLDERITDPKVWVLVHENE